jgi:LysR family transcriptional regulator, hydrogen peroxide-inducible genes activator
MITLIQLEYIIAVDKHRNFARASEACFVTQPTLSMQIKKLEDDLGIVIFDRSRKPVIATEIGRKIIDQAKIVGRENERIGEIIKSFSETITGDLRIGIIPTLAPYLLPRFAGTFKKKFPDVKLTIKEFVTDRIAAGLLTDDLDAGIFVTPFHDGRLKEWPLFYEEMKIYASPGHRLISKPEILIRDVESPEIWLLSDGHCFRDQVINLCSVSKLPNNDLPFEFEGGSLETLIKIIDREGGFTLVPGLAVLEFSDEKLQQVKSFSGYTPLREVSLVFSRNFAKDRLIRLLFEEVRASVPDYMLDKARGDVVEWKKDADQL